VLYLDPWLPPRLPDLTLRDLRVGDQTFDLRFEGVGGDAEVEVLRGDPTRIRRRSFALASELLSGGGAAAWSENGEFYDAERPNKRPRSPTVGINSQFPAIAN